MTITEILTQSRDLLDEKQAAEFLNIAPSTLSVWRTTGRYALPFSKIGRCVRYRRGDLEAFIAERTRTNGATA